MFRWTPHLDESLVFLEEQNECTHDHTLVQLVRVQLIVEKRKAHLSSSNDMSELTVDIEDQATWFSEAKINIFKSPPNDGWSLYLLPSFFL